MLRPYDPWVAWAHLTSPELLTSYGIGLAVLIVSLAGSLVYERFFCKYLCPAGALLGLLSRVSFLNIRRDADACIDCGRCDKACMMNVEVATADVGHELRVHLLQRVRQRLPRARRPQGDGARRRPRHRARRNRRGGGADGRPSSASPRSAARSTGRWRAGPRPAAPATPVEARGRARARGQAKAAGGSDSPIKGWMSFADIAAMTGIPLEEFTAEWGVPAEALGLPMKDVKDQYGFSPEDVRAWVEDRLAQ